MSKNIIMCVISLVVLLILIVCYNSVKNEVSTYTENSNSNYLVCLKENKYYSEKCLGEDIEYVTKITDTINADFNYNIVFQDKITKEFKYYIKSKVIVKTNDEKAKELYKDEKKLTKINNYKLDGNVLNIVESIKIDFDKYNNFAQKYINDYSLLGDSNLHVSIVLIDGKKEKEVSSLIIPLTHLTYSVTKNNIDNEVSEYKYNSDNPIKIVYLVLLVIASLFTLFSIYKMCSFVFRTTSKQTKYQKQLKKILNTYDRVIINLDNTNIINENEIYKVSSFLELLDVRDTIDKPILYYKVNNVKTEFYVQDIHKTYKYTMKEADIEEE